MRKKAKPKEIFVFKRLQLNTLRIIGVISIADSLLPQNADNTHHYKAATACILWHPWLDLGGSPLLILLHDRMSRIQLSQ